MARKDYYHQPDAPKPNSLVPAVSAVVTDSEGKILLHKRSDNFLWSLPGGAMELGESVKQAVIREMKEETGFDVEVLKCIGIYPDPGHVIAFSDGDLFCMPDCRRPIVSQFGIGSSTVFHKRRTGPAGPASVTTNPASRLFCQPGKSLYPLAMIGGGLIERSVRD